MIPILLSFFLFQPGASSWSLIFLFFCFLLVPKSLLCCSRCFGPVLVYVRSSLIYAISPLYSTVSCPLFLLVLQHWHALATGFVGFFIDNCYETHLLLCRPPCSFSTFHTRTGLALAVFYTASALFFLVFFERHRFSCSCNFVQMYILS